ncbi:MAG: rhomboid family intramembrane serine protease [Planctomycetota bacterium]|jgi:membrane associated rhomboid family serine protease|nr:rhomboid family intramembrane serine protease [Planctomycetota bacterium]
MPKEISAAPRQGLFASLGDMIGLITLLWVIEGVDTVLRFMNLTIDGFGIHPRNLWSLPCIFTAPFLHGGWDHLIANSVSLLILGTLSMWYSRRQYLLALGYAVVLGGLFTWLVAPPGGVHIGASGVCFGLMGLLLGNGLFRRRFGAILLALVVAVLFGGTLYLALPSETTSTHHISWQMHLGGFIGGLLASYTSREQRLTRKVA